MEKVVQSEGLIESSITLEEISLFATEAEDIMYKYWQCIKDVRKTLVKEMKNKVPKVKVDHSEVVQTAVKHFYSGDCAKIADLLALNCSGINFLFCFALLIAFVFI
jgi:hypothetical protein